MWVGFCVAQFSFVLTWLGPCPGITIDSCCRCGVVLSASPFLSAVQSCGIPQRHSTWWILFLLRKSNWRTQGPKSQVLLWRPPRNYQNRSWENYSSPGTSVWYSWNCWSFPQGVNWMQTCTHTHTHSTLHTHSKLHTHCAQIVLLGR